MVKEGGSWSRGSFLNSGGWCWQSGCRQHAESKGWHWNVAGCVIFRFGTSSSGHDRHEWQEAVVYGVRETLIWVFETYLPEIAIPPERVFSSGRNNETVGGLDERWDCAKAERDEADFGEGELDLFKIEAKPFKVADSMSAANLILYGLLDWGNVVKPQMVGVDEEVDGFNGHRVTGCEGAGRVPIKQLFSGVFFEYS